MKLTIKCWLKRRAFQEFLDKGYRTGVGNDFNRFGPLKLFVDGSLGARTAYMREPYADDPSTRGIATLTPEEIDTLVGMAVKNNCGVAVHAIGLLRIIVAWLCTPLGTRRLKTF